MSDASLPLNTRKLVYCAIMIVLIIIGSYLSIPAGSVPFVLQNLFVLLAGLLLGWQWALAALAVFLLLGILGLPVFAGGNSGIVYMAGYTGGYLIGYLLAAGTVGLISGLGRQPQKAVTAYVWDVLAVIAGSLIIYLCGVSWLVIGHQMAWPAAVMAGVAPYIIFDAIKAAAAVVLAGIIRPLLKED